MKVKVTQNNSSLCQRQMCTWLGGKWQSSAKQEKNISRCFPKNIFQLFFLSLFGLFPVSVLYWWWFPGAALVNLTQENGAVHFNQSLIHQDCSRNTWQQELFFFILIWTQAGLSPMWVSWWRLSLFQHLAHRLINQDLHTILLLKWLPQPNFHIFPRHQYGCGSSMMQHHHNNLDFQMIPLFLLSKISPTFAFSSFHNLFIVSNLFTIARLSSPSIVASTQLVCNWIFICWVGGGNPCQHTMEKDIGGQSAKLTPDCSVHLRLPFVHHARGLPCFTPLPPPGGQIHVIWIKPCLFVILVISDWQT